MATTGARLMRPWSDAPPIAVRARIAARSAYQQGAQAGRDAFKLSSNENPFGPLPGVVDAAHRTVSFNRYPDASAPRLRARIAERFGVAGDAVHVAAGSTSLLLQFALALCEPGDEILFAWRSFDGYPWMADISGAVPVAVPLDADERHDLHAMADAVTERTRIIVVCSPNNPSGTAVTQTAFDAFLARVPPGVLVLLDEAYIEFVTDAGVVDGRRVIASGHENVVVLRTFSKAYGLAGLRVGYAVGHPRVLEAARIAGIPLSVTAQGEEAALASLDAEQSLLERVKVIAERRDRLAQMLRESGWTIPRSQANFVWLPTGPGTARARAEFADAGLIVRAYGEDGIRITVGEEESLEPVVRVAASLAAIVERV
ncbi:histidinol-phosphate transaminase [Microbacterium murale]|uniref:Histidinol-phosphate aminotransferase n=1 Tax=Microbacterium murale TaxID=1081040 RepID=A0ABU0P724_9MICO|nr:histidinol-phosphate transaminase [Microbacterium murale]MDQ0642697.1 histidinol-phosphate aminotransferase [Microbacterium murale]